MKCKVNLNWTVRKIEKWNENIAGKAARGLVYCFHWLRSLLVHEHSFTFDTLMFFVMPTFRNLLLFHTYLSWRKKLFVKNLFFFFKSFFMVTHEYICSRLLCIYHVTISTLLGFLPRKFKKKIFIYWKKKTVLENNY